MSTPKAITLNAITAKAITRNAITRGFAIAHLIGAAGIAAFWATFYMGLAIPRDELADKIRYFDAYYDFEKAFALPDLLTATVMIIAAVRLLASPENRRMKTTLVAASGALVFLAFLDVNYDVRNGMYSLGHRFSFEIMTVPLIGLLGIATIVWFSDTTKLSELS